ncbi:muscle-specific protein 20-like [Vespula maculifrons]|uniref:Muscle-specific protein 20-like n=1 Tax=Vespula maculifrons TaxID=7453 RepID=A0ABD2CMS7_VESMC
MEWSGMASPRQQQSQQDPIELQEHERVIHICSVPSRVAIFTALVFEVAVGCRRNSSPLRSGRSTPFEYVFLLGVNHGAACRRKPLDLQKNRTKHTAPVPSRTLFVLTLEPRLVSWAFSTNSVFEGNHEEINQELSSSCLDVRCGRKLYEFCNKKFASKNSCDFDYASMTHLVESASHGK